MTHVKDGEVDKEGYDVQDEADDPLQAAHHRLGVLQLQGQVCTLPARQAAHALLLFSTIMSTRTHNISGALYRRQHANCYRF